MDFTTVVLSIVLNAPATKEGENHNSQKRFKKYIKGHYEKSEKTHRIGENICNHMSDRCLLSTEHKTFHCSTTKRQTMSF